jgi:hypothetical protein
MPSSTEGVSFGGGQRRYRGLHYLYERHIRSRDSRLIVYGHNHFDFVNGATFAFTEANGLIMTGPPENLRGEAAYIANYGGN